MWRSLPASLILRGILAIAVGLVAIAWPGVTVLALVILFAVYAFIDAGLQVMRAFSSPAAGPVLGHLLLAVINVGAGVLAIAWPAATALVLVLIVAAWAISGGFAEIVAGFGSERTAGTHAKLVLAGLVSVALGVVLFARPGIGAVSLALLFGLYSLVYGSGQIATGFDARRLGR
jgi:uncharacterized membrane protein HdeD (DUF308 family)